MLLEYADKGNLEEYFQRTQPPSTGEDIVKFWRSLFNVLKALSRIHEVRRTSATGPQIFQGYLFLFREEVSGISANLY